VLKRPFVDEFLKKMGELFECVLFTASLAKVWSTVKSVHKELIGIMKNLFLITRVPYKRI